MQLVLSGLSLGLSVSAFFFFRWYIRRETAATKLLADYRDEVGRLLAEIDAATDRDSRLVEERIKILRKMLEDTDRRIATYVRELQRSRNGEALYTSLGRGIRSALDSRPAPKIAEPVVAEEAPDETAGSPATETDVDEITLPFEKSRIKVKIAEMSADGVPAHEIASKMGISIAEVDLALSLLNRQTG